MLGSLYGIAPQVMPARATSTTLIHNVHMNGSNSSSTEANRRHNRNHTANTSRSLSSHASPQAQTLAMIAADEAAMSTRKLNIQRFGATWLRPAGVAKTLQAMYDEELEKAEVAEQERRARLLAEETAAAEDAARRGAGAGVIEGADEEHTPIDDLRREMARDMDADIPEATGDLEGLGYDEDDGENEVDLDEEIPEAGSYEHTDTEIEDIESDESDLRDYDRSEDTADATRLTNRTGQSTDVSQVMDQD